MHTIPCSRKTVSANSSTQRLCSAGSPEDMRRRYNLPAEPFRKTFYRHDLLLCVSFIWSEAARCTATLVKLLETLEDWETSCSAHFVALRLLFLQ